MFQDPEQPGFEGLSDSLNEKLSRRFAADLSYLVQLRRATFEKDQDLIARAIISRYRDLCDLGEQETARAILTHA